jgi:signal transduction histidine kinase
MSVHGARLDNRSVGHANVESRDRLLALISTIQHLSLARDLDSVIAVVRNSARLLIGADGVTFILRDGSQCYYADESAIGPLWKGRRFPLESCISGWAMMHRHAVAVEDIYTDERIPHDAYRPTFVRSLAMVPIRSVDPVGAIGAYWAAKHRATPEEMEILQALADSVSTAMTNVTLIRDLQAARDAAERRSVETAQLVDALQSELEQRLRAETERESLTLQVQHLQKVDALARLTGGIAHDFNNLLAVMMGGVAIALRQLPADAPGRRNLEVVASTVQRAKSLTSRLLTFSRKQELDRRPIDVNDVVREAEALLRSLIGVEITLDLQLAPDLPHVDADAGQLEQVLVNLVVNARDAMPRGGTLRIQTAEADDDTLLEDVDTSCHRCIVLSVADTGVGMSNEVKEHLFEPFFTTKEPGQGTGLGLATVYGIVKQHGGTIRVQSREGEGTTFRIFLPVANQQG